MKPGPKRNLFNVFPRYRVVEIVHDGACIIETRPGRVRVCEAEDWREAQRLIGSWYARGGRQP